jgi:2-polyprenyl-3-methyl-5-hydroxy-6-metoxy-1,4-benzoquinol methylase
MMFGAIAVGPVWIMTWLWSPQKAFGQIACIAVGTTAAAAIYLWLLYYLEPRVWNDLWRSILKKREPSPIERAFQVVPVKDNSMPRCPICHVNATLVKRITRAELFNDIRKGLELEMPPAAMETDYNLLRCPSCTLEFADPMLPGNSAFYHWLAEQPWYFPVNRWEWDVVIDETRRQGRKKLLEIGCGSGIFLKRITQQLNIRAIGLDLTEGVVEMCNKAGLEVYQGAVENFPQQYAAAVGPVDCAVAFHCLEHVPDPVGFVRSMVDLVGPAGTVFVSTPYSPLCYERLWPDPLNIPPHHLTRWNQQSYQKLGESLGMKVRLFMPDAASDLQRIVRTFALVDRSPMHPGSRGEIIRKMIASPVQFIQEIRHQRSRDIVNEKPAADVVLVQFYK